MGDRQALLGVAGLSSTSEQVYLFVVHHGQTRSHDVADRFDLSPTGAQAALEELLEVGLIVRSDDAEPSYTAVDPRYALGALADQVSAEARRIRERIPLLADQFQRTIVDDPRSAAQTRVLTTQGDISAWYVRLQHQAERELLVFDRPPYYASHLEPVEVNMIARGVVWRGLYTPASFEADGAWPDVVRLAELGEQGRMVPHLPVKLAMVDRAVALVSLRLDGVRPDSLVTESPPLLELLHEMFEVYWSRGVPLSPHAEGPPDLGTVAAAPAGARRGAAAARRALVPTTEQQGILAMISAGMTDEAIAVRLGLSVRSLRRRSQRLKTDLGAANRFQLGAEAARRGWI